MRLLLDTHALLWWLIADPRLGQTARDLIADPANDVLVSVASLWEIQVKVRVGKMTADLDGILAEIRNQGFELIGITPAHLLALGLLPRHHGDPWDHLLIAQANAEGAVFLSEDRHVPAYPVAFVTCSGSSHPGVDDASGPRTPRSDGGVRRPTRVSRRKASAGRLAQKDSRTLRSEPARIPPPRASRPR